MYTNWWILFLNEVSVDKRLYHRLEESARDEGEVNYMVVK